jgi:biopolymer transport protein ExbB/TolQ
VRVSFDPCSGFGDQQSFVPYLFALALGALSVLWLARVLNRAFIHVRRWVHARRFDARVKPLIAAAAWDKVGALGEEKSLRQAPAASALAAGATAWLSQSDADRTLAWDMSREASLSAMKRRARADRRTERPLALLAALAPLAGLVGAVCGVTNAFWVMSLTGKGGFAAISLGLAESLVPCGWGLALGIASLWSWWLCAACSERERSFANRSARRLMEALAAAGDASKPERDSR